MKSILLFILAFFLLFLAACSSSSNIKPGTYSIAEETESFSEDTKEFPAVLQAGDQISLNVWRVDDLNQAVKIDMRGNINLVLVGEVHAEGKTIEELRQVVTLRLAQFYKNPVVSISVESFASQEYYLLGEIINSGKQTLDRKLTAFEAIVSAGGYTDDADDYLLLIRKQEKSLRIIKANFDLTDIEKGRFNAHELVVAQGDIIYIPTSRRSNLEKFASTLSTLLSPLMDIERMIVLWPNVIEALEDRNDVTVAF